jgi:alkylation response protein AidB-like acyl-CoA dehydrogenase
VNLGLVGQAVGMFAVTNIDDIVVLALFFGQAAWHHGAATKVVVGQYLGFAAILAASVVGATAGGGFGQLMEPPPKQRLSIAYHGLAATEAALAWTLAYVKERRAFGQAIARLRHTTFSLAELASSSR